MPPELALRRVEPPELDEKTLPIQLPVAAEGRRRTRRMGESFGVVTPYKDQTAATDAILQQGVDQPSDLPDVSHHDLRVPQPGR